MFFFNSISKSGYWTGFDLDFTEVLWTHILGLFTQEMLLPVRATKDEKFERKEQRKATTKNPVLGDLFPKIICVTKFSRRNKEKFSDILLIQVSTMMLLDHTKFLSYIAKLSSPNYKALL